MALESYRQLRVWQRGMQLAKDIHLLVQNFPKYEIYGLCSQLRRAAVSIPANLAEGHERESTKDYLRHISIAQGSLAETETHLLLAESLNYAASKQIAPLLDICMEQRRMLSGLRRSLKAKLNTNP